MDLLDPAGGARLLRVGRLGRPRFVEIVGPYKKWGGDNADAFYQYARLDPTRTYRVTLRTRATPSTSR